MTKEFFPSELLYLPLDFPKPPKNFFNCLITELDSIEVDSVKNFTKLNTEALYFDTYRNSGIVHLCDTEGTLMPVVEKYQQNDEATNWFSLLQNTFKPTRCALTVTFPGDTVPYHIDCSPSMSHTLQHKVRYIVRGEERLDFGLKKNTSVSPKLPWVDELFVFSGKWPHTLKNTSDRNVYIFTMGSPWEAKLDDTKYLDLLNKSFLKFKDYYLSNRDLELPEKYFQFYEEKYKV